MEKGILFYIQHKLIFQQIWTQSPSTFQLLLEFPFLNLRFVP